MSRAPLWFLFVWLVALFLLATGCKKKDPPRADEPGGVVVVPEPAPPGPIPLPGPAGPAQVPVGPRAADREPKPDPAAGQTLTVTRRAVIGARDGSPSTLAFTPDGQWLLTGGKSIKVWNLRTGKLDHLLPVFDEKQLSWAKVFAISPDGKYLATSGPEGAMWVWDLAAGTHRAFKSKQFSLYKVAFTADGKTVYTLHSDVVCRWDVATGQQTATSDKVVYALIEGALAVSPDGKTVVTGGKDKAVVVLDGETLKEKKRFPGHTSDVNGAALSPDGATLATIARDDKTIRLWDLKGGAESRTIKNDTGTLRTVSFFPSGLFLLTGGDAATIWDVATGAKLASPDELRGIGDSLTVSPDGSMLAATGDYKRGVMLWDVSCTWETRSVARPKDRYIAAVAPGGSQCATKTAEGVELLNLTTGKSERVLPGKAPGVLAYSHDGKLLARATEDRDLLLVDTATGETKATLKIEVEPEGLAFRADGKRLAVGKWGELQVWDLTASPPKMLFNTESRLRGTKAPTFSPDGRTVALGTRYSVTVVDAETGRVIWTAPAHETELSTVAFSPDGARLVTVGAYHDRAVRVWDAATGKVVAVLRHNTQLVGVYSSLPEVSCAFFGPDPTTVVTATTDGTYHLWDVEKAERLGTRTARKSDGWGISFTPDRKVFVTVSEMQYHAWNAASLNRAAFAPVNDSVRDLYTVPVQNGFMPVRESRPAKGMYGAYNMYSADGSRLVSVDTDQITIVWDGATRKELKRFSLKIGDVLGLAVSHDGKQIAVSLRDKTIRIVDPATGQELKKLVGHTSFVRCVAFSPDGKWLASGNGGFDETELILWHAPTGTKAKELARGGGWIDEIVFSPDSKWLVVGTSKDARVFDVESGRERFTLDHPESVLNVAVSRDGRLIAVGGSAFGSNGLNDVTIWDAATGKLLRSLPHHAPINDIAFGTDGLLAVSTWGSLDLFTYLWNAETGAFIARFAVGDHHGISPKGDVLVMVRQQNLHAIDLKVAGDPRVHAALAPALAVGGSAELTPNGVRVELRLHGPDSLAALEALKDFPLPFALVISDAELVPDAAVRALTTMKTLRGLNFGFSGLSDEQLKVITGLGQLEELALDSCRELTAPGLAGLASLKRLKRLTLSNTKAGAETLTALTALPELRYLDLRATTTEADSVAALAKFPKLEELVLGAPEDDAVYARLADLKSLKRLVLSGSGIGPAGFVHLKGLTHLEELDLSQTGIDDASLTHLSGFVNLKVLDLSRTKVTDAGFVHLKKLTKLTAVRVAGLENLTGAGLAHLSGAKGVSELDLRATGVTDTGLAGLKDWDQLETLALPDTITDAGLLHLENLTHLGSLNLDQLEKVKGSGLAGLRNSRITELDLRHIRDLDAGLVGLKDWKHLKALVLPKSVTDTGLAHLSGLTALEGLDLYNAAGVTDAGVAHLKGLVNLRELDLRGTKITDACLKHVAGFKSLVKFRAPQSGVTEKGLEELKKQLPGLEAYRF